MSKSGSVEFVDVLLGVDKLGYIEDGSSDGKLPGATSIGDGLFEGCKLRYNVPFVVGDWINDMISLGLELRFTKILFCGGDSLGVSEGVGT